MDVANSPGWPVLPKVYGLDGGQSGKPSTLSGTHVACAQRPHPNLLYRTHIYNVLTSVPRWSLA